MDLSQVVALAGLGISLVSVVVAFYAVRESRKSVFSDTYFSEMVSAYAQYLGCVANFVNRRGLPERDALAPALYRLELFAPKLIAIEAQELFTLVIDWARAGQERALLVD